MADNNILTGIENIPNLDDAAKIDSIRVVLRKIEKVDELQKEDFKDVKTKEDFKKALVNFFNKASFNWLKPSEIAGPINDIVDAVWKMYEAVSGAGKTFWDWLKDNFFEITNRFNSKFGTPNELAVRKFIDTVYGVGYQIQFNNGKYHVVSPAGVIILQNEMKAINGNEGEQGSKVLNRRKVLETILTERSLTEGGEKELRDILIYSGISPTDKEKINQLEPKDLANAYLRYAQRPNKNCKVLPEITKEEVRTMKNLPQIQKDYILMKMDPRSPLSTENTDIGFLKKAIDKHNETLFVTGLGLKNLAKDTVAEGGKRTSEMLKDVKEIKNYIGKEEIVVLFVAFLATMVFDMTGKRKEIWQYALLGGGGLVLANMLTKFYNKDKDKGLLYALGAGVEKGAKKADSHTDQIEKIAEKLGIAPDDVRVLLNADITNMPAEKIFKGLEVDGDGELKFKNYELLFDKGQRDKFDQTFGEGKGKEKILDCFKRFLKKSGGGSNNFKKTIQMLMEKYPSDKFLFGQVIFYELDMVKSDTKNTEKPLEGKNFIETATVLLDQAYKGTGKLRGVPVTKENILTGLKTSKTNAEKIKDLELIKCTEPSDTKLIETLIEELRKQK